MGPFEGMLRAQLKLDRADAALEYLERGRSRAMLDLLDRGNRLRGGDVLSVVEAKARAEQDQALLDHVLRLRSAGERADSHVRALTAEISLARGRRDLSEDQRGRLIEGLQKQLGESQQRAASANREVFNLAGEYGSADLKPLSARQIQAMLSGKERLLVYTVTGSDAIVLVVGPTGQAVVPGETSRALLLGTVCVRWRSTVKEQPQDSRRRYAVRSQAIIHKLIPFAPAAVYGTPDGTIQIGGSVDTTAADRRSECKTNSWK